ncbi:MAG TPA: GTP cyclohydrolase I FolE [Chloroflexota bacterium]|nr:GTP cyclohydrolase I FolE [Chloroflexota bacterium]
MIDRPGVEAAVRALLRAIGEDPDRPGLRETPRRIADLYAEVFAGLHQDPAALLDVTFDEEHQEMVVLRDVRFESMCEHHLVPFYGLAHIGYVPQGRIVGISKLARAVEVLARRPQVQERLTSQIADLLMERLQPAGVGVVLIAEHHCMTMRGIRKPGSKVVTSANRGVFRDCEATRLEFLSLIADRHA